MRFRLVEGKLKDGQIHTALPFEAIFALLLDANIVIVKQVFDPQELRPVRSRVFTWGQTTTQADCALTASNHSWHQIDDNPASAKTPHAFHGYAFVVEESDVVDDIGCGLRAVFDPLRDFQIRLTGTARDYRPNAAGYALRPQILQYPVGGGFFARHTHAFDPCKIGLIVGLSQQGVDFNTGGTRFFVDDIVVDTTEIHDLGDICLFRHDIPHEVTPIDQDVNLDWSNECGRWSIVMPFF